MSSFLYSVLIGCIVVCNANACDIRFEEVSPKEPKSLKIIKLPNNHIGSGCVIEMVTEEKKKNIVLSCHHILGDYLYDHFNEPESFMELDKSKTTKKSIYSKEFQKYSFDYMRLISNLYSTENFIVNKTKSRKNIALQTKNVWFDLYKCKDHYLSFCRDYVPMPIEISCILPKDGMLADSEKYKLPSDEIIDSWPGKNQEVVAYGHSKINYCEYKMTCSMQLSSDREWFKNMSVIDSIDDFFMKCAGMSGGPCFIDGNLCGVVSGINGKGHLYMKAITKDIVHALNNIANKI